MKKQTGNLGENLARTYLEEQGYRILASNYRTPFGEVDLIAAQEDLLVFVEVKTRRSGAFGLPREAVNLKKQQNYYRLATAYLQRYPQPHRGIRFDVMEVYLAGEAHKIEHLINAF